MYLKIYLIAFVIVCLTDCCVAQYFANHPPSDDIPLSDLPTFKLRAFSEQKATTYHPSFNVVTEDPSIVKENVEAIFFEDVISSAEEDATEVQGINTEATVTETELEETQTDATVTETEATVTETNAAEIDYLIKPTTRKPYTRRVISTSTSNTVRKNSDISKLRSQKYKKIYYQENRPRVVTNDDFIVTVAGGYDNQDESSIRNEPLTYQTKSRYFRTKEQNVPENAGNITKNSSISTVVVYGQVTEKKEETIADQINKEIDNQGVKLRKIINNGYLVPVPVVYDNQEEIRIRNRPQVYRTRSRIYGTREQNQKENISNDYYEPLSAPRSYSKQKVYNVVTEAAPIVKENLEAITFEGVTLSAEDKASTNEGTYTEEAVTETVTLLTQTDATVSETEAPVPVPETNAAEIDSPIKQTIQVPSSQRVISTSTSKTVRKYSDISKQSGQRYKKINDQEVRSSKTVTNDEVLVPVAVVYDNQDEITVRNRPRKFRTRTRNFRTQDQNIAENAENSSRTSSISTSVVKNKVTETEQENFTDLLTDQAIVKEKTKPQIVKNNEYLVQKTVTYGNQEEMRIRNRPKVYRTRSRNYRTRERKVDATVTNDEVLVPVAVVYDNQDESTVRNQPRKFRTRTRNFRTQDQNIAKNAENSSRTSSISTSVVRNKVTETEQENFTDLLTDKAIVNEKAKLQIIENNEYLVPETDDNGNQEEIKIKNRQKVYRTRSRNYGTREQKLDSTVTNGEVLVPVAVVYNNQDESTVKNRSRKFRARTSNYRTREQYLAENAENLSRSSIISTSVVNNKVTERKKEKIVDQINKEIDNQEVKLRKVQNNDYVVPVAIAYDNQEEIRIRNRPQVYRTRSRIYGTREQNQKENISNDYYKPLSAPRSYGEQKVYNVVTKAAPIVKENLEAITFEGVTLSAEDKASTNEGTYTEEAVTETVTLLTQTDATVSETEAPVPVPETNAAEIDSPIKQTIQVPSSQRVISTSTSKTVRKYSDISKQSGQRYKKINDQEVRSSKTVTNDEVLVPVAVVYDNQDEITVRNRPRKFRTRTRNFRTQDQNIAENAENSSRTSSISTSVVKNKVTETEQENFTDLLTDQAIVNEKAKLQIVENNEYLVPETDVYGNQEEIRIKNQPKVYRTRSRNYRTRERKVDATVTNGEVLVPVAVVYNNQDESTVKNQSRKFRARTSNYRTREQNLAENLSRNSSISTSVVNNKVTERKKEKIVDQMNKEIDNQEEKLRKVQNNDYVVPVAIAYDNQEEIRIRNRPQVYRTRSRIYGTREQNQKENINNDYYEPLSATRSYSKQKVYNAVTETAPIVKENLEAITFEGVTLSAEDKASTTEGTYTEEAVTETVTLLTQTDATVSETEAPVPVTETNAAEIDSPIKQTIQLPSQSSKTVREYSDISKLRGQRYKIVNYQEIRPSTTVTSDEVLAPVAVVYNNQDESTVRNQPRKFRTRTRNFRTQDQNIAENAENPSRTSSISNSVVNNKVTETEQENFTDLLTDKAIVNEKAKLQIVENNKYLVPETDVYDNQEEIRIRDRPKVFRTRSRNYRTREQKIEALSENTTTIDTKSKVAVVRTKVSETSTPKTDPIRYFSDDSQLKEPSSREITSQEIKSRTVTENDGYIVPVAVVYNDESESSIRNQQQNYRTISQRYGTREQKQVESAEKTPINSKTLTPIVNTEVNQTTIKQENRKLSNKEKTYQETKSKTVTANDGYIVPVAVVYNNEEENRISEQQNHRAISRNSRTRQERVLENKESTTWNTQTRTAVVTNRPSAKETVIVVPKTFPKRTSEIVKQPVTRIVDAESYIFSDSGNYHFSYEGADGTKAFERGELKEYNNDLTGQAVVGGYSYTDKDGNDFSLSYTADENGYRPVGAHLPTPPPIPPAIARALAYLATKTTDSDATTESL